MAPCSFRLPSSAKRTSLRAAMSTFNRASSCATKAERRSGQLLSAVSNMVLMFQHAMLSPMTPLQVGVDLFSFDVV